MQGILDTLAQNLGGAQMGQLTQTIGADGGIKDDLFRMAGSSVLGKILGR